MVTENISLYIFYFSCFESYADNDQECPACASENHKVLDIIKAQEQGRDLHEQFHRQVCVVRGVVEGWERVVGGEW